MCVTWGVNSVTPRSSLNLNEYERIVFSFYCFNPTDILLAFAHFAIFTIQFYFIFLDRQMIGACKMSFREPGKSDFSPITTSGVLTKQILISKGIRYHDNTKTYDTFRYTRPKVFLLLQNLQIQ